MAPRGAVAEWLGRGLQSPVQRFESARRLSPQVSLAAQVSFYEVGNPLRQQREYAVREAARRERDAWTQLERARRPEAADEETRHAFRERWHAAANALVDALRAVKR
jgi:hypothetical protein